MPHADLLRAGELFAGPGGWSHGLRSIAPHVHQDGVEIDADAVATARAAGHSRIHADVLDLDPVATFGEGLDLGIYSPPCQTFSAGGLRAGLDDPRGQLVHEPMRWTRALLPRAVVCEQVPAVLPIWQAHAHELRELGYRTWTGILNAADYGVPQDRPRAVLIARRDGIAASPPPATHADHVSMAQATGWPAGYVGFPRRYDRGRLVVLNGQEYRGRDLRSTSRPSFTITGKARSWSRWALAGGDKTRVELHEASLLQGFPADYPWQGSRTSAFQQLSNTIPPPMAAAILAPLVGAAAGRIAA